MPRRIFPAGTVTNTTGAPLRLEFYPTSTSTRRETDMWTIDSSNNLVERITNGVIVTDSVGAYSAFAGPDDLDTLYALPNNTTTRTTLTASAGLIVPGDNGSPIWATPAASTTLTGTLAAWVVTAVDCTAGAGARTLPAASSVTAGTPVCAKKADTSTNNLVVSRAGSDLIFGTGSGATSKTLSLAGEAVEFVSNGVGKWTVRSSDTPSGILATTYAGVVDTLSLRRLTTLAASDAATSAVASRIAYEDNTAFTEAWSDTSAWALGAAATQVSGGYLYSGATRGSGSGMNHSYSGVGTTGTMRAVTTVIPVTTVSGGVIVGVSSDTAGATPTAGGATARGVYFHGSQIDSWNNGVNTNIGTFTSGATYIVTITADSSYLTITAAKSDGSAEVRTKWARAGFSINNLYIFNSDSHTTSGCGVGPLGSRQAIATVSPRTGIEGVGQTIHWTSISSDVNSVRIAFPATYDSRKPSPLAICFHGNTTDETTWSSNTNGRTVANALTAAGYIVLGANYAANSSTWGAQASLDAYYAAYQYVRNNYAIGPVVFYGNSMGGLESLLTLAERRIPGVVAWVGTSPSCSLANAYADPGSQGFTALINTAYGISGDYAAKTSGHDPALKAGYAFRGVPMLFLAATDDTFVPKTANTDVLAALVTPYVPIATVQTGITGGHSFSFSSYTSQITSFFDTYSKG